MSNLRAVNKVLTEEVNPVSNFSTEKVDITNIPIFSFQVICTGTLACVASVSGSNEVVNDNYQTPTFTVISGTSQTLTAGTTFIYNLISQGYKYARVNISSITGSGTLKIIYNGKNV